MIALIGWGIFIVVLYGTYMFVNLGVAPEDGFGMEMEQMEYWINVCLQVRDIAHS